MNNDCQMWMALSDKAALGESTTLEERAFLEDHVGACPACRTEASVWRALEGALEDPRLLTEPLASLSSGVQPAGIAKPWFRALPAWSKRALIVGAAALVLALPTALAVHAWRTHEGTNLSENAAIAALSPNVGSARLAFVSGEASINARPAVAGEPLFAGDTLDVAEGYACLLVPPGVTVCVDPHSRLSMEKLERATRRFRLSSGHALARLDHQPLGSTFGFETAAGSVVAKGTVFSVEALGEETAVRVQEGTVLGTHAGLTHAFTAPVSALLSQPQSGQLPEEAVADDLRLLAFARNFSDRATSVLQVTASGGGDVKLDDAYLGAIPLSALVEPGSHRLVYEHAGLPPIAERLTLADGERAVRNYENASAVGDARDGGLVGTFAGAGTAAVLGSGAAQHPTSTPASLLLQARELRAEGHFAEASATYRRLLREHAGSAEARAALVSLGELQLSQLGDANGALRSFDAYLRAGGALAQEASYGKIRALRALGRHSDEQAAIAAFLQAYPQSVQAGALRKDAP